MYFEKERTIAKEEVTFTTFDNFSFASSYLREWFVGEKLSNLLDYKIYKWLSVAKFRRSFAVSASHWTQMKTKLTVTKLADYEFT